MIQNDPSALLGLIEFDSIELEGNSLEEMLDALEGAVKRLLQPKSDEQIALLMRIAKTIIGIGQSTAVDRRIRMLNDIAWVFRPLGRPAQGIVLLHAAIKLAVDHGERALERKSRSTLSCLYNDSGIHTRSAEEAVKATEIAKELGDNRGCAAALLNLSTALRSLGLFRETISVCLRIVAMTKGDRALRAVEAGAYGNLATAAYGLRDYKLGTRSAERAVEVAGIPTDESDILNVLAMESIWIKNLLGAGDGKNARERLEAMDRIVAAIDLPRYRLNVELARGHVEIADGELRVGVSRLLGLLPKTQGAAPGLHVDNLDALIRAYERAGDYDAMARYVAQIVSLRMEGQAKAIKTQLALAGQELKTRMPGKEDAYPLVHTVAHANTPTSAEAQDGVHVSIETRQEMFERMAVTAEIREDETGTHAYRVGTLALRLTERMGYGELFCKQMELASRLHDIGKLGVRDGVLNKPDRFSPEDRNQMEMHAEYGAKLLKLAPHPEFGLAGQIAIGHHERWDGRGYPYKQSGKLIPEVARIAACADVWDALTHSRVYKEAWSFEETLKYFRENLGKHFDPAIGAAFVKMMEEAIILNPTHESLDAWLRPEGAIAFNQTRATMRELVTGLPYEWQMGPTGDLLEARFQ